VTHEDPVVLLAALLNVACSRKLLTSLLLDFDKVWKESGGDKSTGLFPELILEDLVFLCYEFYSIFLLQQEASAL
jgi:hypothetical protein